MRGITERVGDGFSGVQLSRAKLNDLLCQAASEGVAAGQDARVQATRKGGGPGRLLIVPDWPLLALTLGAVFLAVLFGLGDAVSDGCQAGGPSVIVGSLLCSLGVPLAAITSAAAMTALIAAVAALPCFVSLLRRAWESGYFR